MHKKVFILLKLWHYCKCECDCDCELCVEICYRVNFFTYLFPLYSIERVGKVKVVSICKCDVNVYISVVFNVTHIMAYRLALSGNLWSRSGVCVCVEIAVCVWLCNFCLVSRA